MKTCKSFITVLLLFALTTSYAQNDTQVFDPNSSLKWLGIDFTKTIFIGDRENLRSANIPGLLESINKLMITEVAKYDVAEMLHRTTAESQIDVTMDHNSMLSTDHIQTEDVKRTKRLNLDSISAIVESYDFKGLTGTGLMFNVETFSKTQTVAHVWITFVDMGTKKVLFTRRMTATPSGFGLRNYWAGSIYRIMKEIDRSYYNSWSKR